MSKGLAFWLIFLIAILFGGWYSYGMGLGYFGGSLIVFVLIGIIGWAQFGPPIR
jgi:hypothetical protein